MFYGKSGSTEHSKGNKTIPGKVATKRREDGHNRLPKQALQTKGTKEHRTPKEKMEGPTSS